MADKDYTVKEWKQWVDRESGEPVQDLHGNTKGTLVLSDVGEPVDGTFKRQPSNGDVLYGHIEDYETRAGNTRQRFRRVERPQETPKPFIGNKPAYQPRDDSAIQAQWALNQAREWVQYNAGSDTTVILEYAKEFFGMIDQVKASKQEPSSDEDNWERV